MKNNGPKFYDDNSQKEVLAIIPARGGSKGILQKNIALLGGQPLLAYSVQVALYSRFITRVIVSTDDPQIAEIAIRLGAEVPFLRPEELAGDRASIDGAVNHLLQRLGAEEGYCPDALVQLYPTHPFRTPTMVDRLTRILLGDFRKVITVKNVRIDTPPMATIDSAGHIALWQFSRRQSKKPPVFQRPYGLYYGLKLKGHSPLATFIEPVSEPIVLIDIDEPEDLRFAEAVLQANLFEFGVPCCS